MTRELDGNAPGVKRQHQHRRSGNAKHKDHPWFVDKSGPMPGKHRWVRASDTNPTKDRVATALARHWLFEAMLAAGPLGQVTGGEDRAPGSVRYAAELDGLGWATVKKARSELENDIETDHGRWKLRTGLVSPMAALAGFPPPPGYRMFGAYMVNTIVPENEAAVRAALLPVVIGAKPAVPRAPNYMPDGGHAAREAILSHLEGMKPVGVTRGTFLAYLAPAGFRERTIERALAYLLGIERISVDYSGSNRNGGRGATYYIR